MEMKKASITGQESGHLNAALSLACLARLPASKPNPILQIGIVCALKYDPHSGVFHLNSHEFFGCKRAKLSLTNQCLPWHPKAA